RTLPHLALEPSRPQPAAHSALVDAERLRTRLALCDPARRLAQDVRESPLEVPDAGLARVLTDDQPQRPVGDRDAVAAESVGFELLRHEVALADPELLVVGVAGELDHVHAVEQ